MIVFPAPRARPISCHFPDFASVAFIPAVRLRGRAARAKARCWHRVQERAQAQYNPAIPFPPSEDQRAIQQDSGKIAEPLDDDHNPINAHEIKHKRRTALPALDDTIVRPDCWTLNRTIMAGAPPCKDDDTEAVDGNAKV